MVLNSCSCADWMRQLGRQIAFVLLLTQQNAVFRRQVVGQFQKQTEQTAGVGLGRRGPPERKQGRQGCSNGVGSQSICASLSRL